MRTMSGLSNLIIGSLLVLSIALCGCFDTRHLQVDVTEHVTGTGELQDQITRLNDQVEQLTARYGDLEGRLQTVERLIRSYPPGDLSQIQDIQKSIVTLQTEIRDQDERAAVAALTMQMITLQGQLLSITKADTQTIQLMQEYSATTNIERAIAKASPTPTPESGQYRRSDLIAGEVVYDTYLGVTGLLIGFLGVCLLWGIWKVISSLFVELRELLSKNIRAMKRFWDWFAPTSTIPVALLCLVSALALVNGAAWAEGPLSTPSLTVPGSGIPTEIQHQLIDTLWQAPLAILTIVLAIGGFFGWQAYKELSDRLYRRVSEKVISEAQTLGGFSLVLGQITTALGIWKLAVELVIEKSPGGPPKSLADSEKAEKEFDKKLQRTNEYPETAASHIRAAKYILFQAVGHLARLPDDVDLPVTYLLRSSVVRMEAKQAYAYQIATDYFSTPSEWEDALRYSREALTFSEDQKLLEAQLGGDKIRALERAAAWADTFLYVRALFEEAAKKFQEADQREAAQKKATAERPAAVKLYQQLPLNEQFRDVRERFSERFGT